MEHTTIAVDLAKSVFQVAVSHRPGHLDEEATASARSISQRSSRSGRRRRSCSRPAGPRTTGPGNSNSSGTRSGCCRRMMCDRTSGATRLTAPTRKALLEANRNEEIHPVPVKTIEHQAIASLHRLRSTWLATRTARLNTIRGLLREFGIFIPVGCAARRPSCPGAALEDPAVPPLLHATLAAACDEIEVLEANMRAVERQLAALATTCPMSRCCKRCPAWVCITATALVALVGDIRRFPSGRHFASFLGLTPKRRLQRRCGDGSGPSANKATSMCGCS